jgi:type IV pilus assembly protein PilN
MIKINLLAAERKVAKKGGGFAIQTGQTLTVACGLILVGAVFLVGWRFWSLNRESARLDQEITSAQQETARLHSIIQQVQQFEQRRAQLQQRVALIEELRRNQTGPVHMLDQISRALPEMLWLTALKQGADPNEVLIDGLSTSPTTVSDFVANLEASGYFKRSVEIVSTQVQTITGPPGELVKFQVRAIFQQPGASSTSPTALASASTNRAN